MGVEPPAGRLAEVTVALSLATDLGTGQPMEHGLRTCCLSMAVADALGLDADERSGVYYVALLRFLGCTSDASDVAALAGGDDVAFNAAMAPILMAPAGEATVHFVRHLGEDLPLGRRAGRVARALADPGWAGRSSAGHCEVGARLADRLGLGPAVGWSMAHAFERWDGKGHPDGLAGDDVPVAVRIVAAARDAELFTRTAGWPRAAAVLARRRGRGYDPAVVDAVLDGGPACLAALDADDVYARTLDAEPAPRRHIDDLDGALLAVADFTDLTSPWLRGHSRGVADLVRAASGAAGMDTHQATHLARAALVHDVGRVGVPSGIWDHPGPLTTTQWERVRLHPYLTERVLRRATVLRDLADVAGRHHERADGSGYHRGAGGDELDAGARLLAAADAFHAMTEARPHRPALASADAAAQLHDAVAAGRFGAGEVRAVLTAAGEPTSLAAATNPAGLTDREVEVLRLIARGQANKQVAAQLHITSKTVGHHVEHVYAKIGVRTRAGATLFAMEHDLLT